MPIAYCIIDRPLVGGLFLPLWLTPLPRLAGMLKRQKDDGDG